MNDLKAERSELEQVNSQPIKPRTIIRRQQAVAQLEGATLEAIAATHEQDADCTVNPENDCCIVCGVDHGAEPCDECGARAFHAPMCSLSDTNQAEPTIADLNAAIRQARAIVAQTGAVAVIIKNESGYAALHEPDYHFGHNPAGIVARVFSQTEIVVYACPVSPDPETSAREDTDAAAPRAEVCDTWSEPAALRRSFGTKPARTLKPARQDELFNPMPQRRLF